MSEKTFKAPRLIAEISQEYSALCARAGQLQYQLFTMSNDLDLLNETLKELNAEAFAAQQAEKEAQAKKAAEAAAAPAPTEQVQS